MAKISRDFSSGNLHPRENPFGSGTISALNGAVTVVADGCNSVSINIAAGLTGTVTLEGSSDATNWFPIAIRNIAALGSIGSLAIGATSSGLWVGPCQYYSQVRARCSAYTSGSALVTLVADNGIMIVEAALRSADLYVTNTAASGVAVTLTLPAAPSLFHFITRMEIKRFAASLLTAGATPVIVTTTNLNSRALSIPADAAMAGTMFSENIEAPLPIKAAVAGTATTIVAPATTGVIWRISASYYTSM